MEWGGRKIRINSKAALQLSFVIRCVLPHVTGKDAETIVTYTGLSNSTVASQTVEIQ
jgi:hypothetical protein